MSELGAALVGAPVALLLYAYAGYPLALRVLAAFREAREPPGGPWRWPSVSVSLPAYNEEGVIGATIESLLDLDYPGEKQIVVISDGSTDGTDEILRRYADRGVELVRPPVRAGKTAAEAAAFPHLRGEIVVNTDASVRILPGSLERLVAAFRDPTVGVASGRDVSVGRADAEASAGEGSYVDYEMRVRALETRVGSIVGASGCFYAARRALHETPLPPALSRDFAAALHAREAGLRAVSVDDAVCLVPRSPSLRAEFRRKVRTMARGLETLWFKRRLLNPFRHGRFAWMLFSHKLCRWLGPPSLLIALAGLLLLVPPPGRWMLMGGCAAALLVGLIALRGPEERSLPPPLGWLAYAAVANLAALVAWARALSGERDPTWEPTRRGAEPRGA